MIFLNENHLPHLARRVKQKENYYEVGKGGGGEKWGAKKGKKELR